MSGSGVVFHFSDTLRLPWILATGELRQGVTFLSDATPLRYLWGTTNAGGDLTAMPMRQINHGGLEEEWQAGAFHLVRFTLPADAFLSFREIIQESDWSAEEVAALIEYDRQFYGETGHDMWRCRHDPIRLANVLQVETTSFADAETERWHPLDISRPERLLIRSRKPNRLGVRIGRRRFHSDRFEYSDRRGSYYYAPWPEPAVTKAKRAAAALERRMELAYLRRRQRQEQWEESQW